MRLQTFIFFCLGVYGCSGQTKGVEQGQAKSAEQDQFKYTDEDSVFIYENFFYYDSDSKNYEDVDESWLFEYWQEKEDSAYYYCEKAVFLNELPPHQKMIFASYLYNKKGDDKLVRAIISKPMDKGEMRYVYNIMSSYGIPFSEFGISKETIKKCCPDLEYQ